MDAKWVCPMCGSQYEEDLAKELFYSCCVDTKLVPIDNIVEKDKEKKYLIEKY